MKKLSNAASAAVLACVCALVSVEPGSGGVLTIGMSAASAQTASAYGTATQHYNAGRIGTSEYIAYGSEYGYITPFTLYQLPDGSWTDEAPGGGGSGGGGGGTTPGSWSTQGNLAGMEVHLYTPNSTTANGQRALMVALHGCAQANEIVRDNWSWQDEADEYGMVIAAPMAPNGGVIAGCWDYYDSNHRRSNPGRHDDNLINLAQSLLGDSSLNIDPDQVYISGLSSGGGESFVIGCVAPEIFAGMGIAAGPAVGTSSSQIGSVATSSAQAANTCRSFANAGNDGSFDTQVTSVVHGTSDFTVAQGYSDVNAAAMASIYGASQDQGTSSISGGGTETTYSDAEGPRVQKIFVQNLGHAWPASNDSSGGAYTDHSTIDYPAEVTAFFFANNRRADFTSGDTTPPAVPSGLAVAGVTANSVSLSWNSVSDPDLAGYRVYRDGQFAGNASGTSFTASGLGSGTNYSFTVSAIDSSGNESAESSAVSATTSSGGGGGDTTPPAAPSGLAVTASTETSLTLDWSDNSEGDLAGYRVTLDGALAGQPSSSSFTFGGLASGSSYELGVSAVDTSGNISQPSSLVAQTASPPASCQATTASNYAHVSAGRAYRCGSWNSYACAAGSGDSMGLWNLYVVTTLAETSPGFYELGSCPAN